MQENKLSRHNSVRAAVSNGQTTSQALTEVENKRRFYAESQSTASHLFARTRSFHLPTFIRPTPWFDSYSVRNCQEQVIDHSHITFRDCRVHIFSDNLSRNSCKQAVNKSTHVTVNTSDILCFVVNFFYGKTVRHARKSKTKETAFI